jgi:Fic family protein
VTDAEKVITLLERTNELVEVLVRAAMEPKLRGELATEKSRELYKLTGGTLPVKGIAARLGLSVGTISRTWQRWEELGLLVKDGKRYRRLLA